jgi:prefoldin subunit 5
MMRELAEKRITELRDEQQKGQQALAELEGRAAELRQTLLRIIGAIQILEELLKSAEP